MTDAPLDLPGFALSTAGLTTLVWAIIEAPGRGWTDPGVLASFAAAQPEVRAAHSVSGDADYVLELQVRDLDALADFIHDRLLQHSQVTQVRSEIVLKSAKEDGGLPI